MAGRKKLEKQKLTRSELDNHVKAFLQKGGEVVIVPRGKSAFQNDKPIK